MYNIPLIFAAAIWAAPSEAASENGLRKSTYSQVQATHSTAEQPYSIAVILPQPKALGGFQVVNRASGATFRIYHDEVSRETARSAIATLDGIYSQVAALLNVKPGEVIWHPVTFTSDPDNAPKAAQETRWVIPTEKDGRLAGPGEEALYSLVPHEQVHAVQTSFAFGKLPQWFSEGQASWAGLQVTEAHRKSMAARQRSDKLEAARKMPQVKLSDWTIRFKRAAFYRQATPEERLKMDKDPSFMPAGPFAFLPGDMEGQTPEENGARYGLSLRLFDYMDAKAGRKALQDWFSAVWRAGTGLSKEQLQALAKQHLGVELDPFLSGSAIPSPPS